jgi:transcription elongation factor Elf1
MTAPGPAEATPPSAPAPAAPAPAPRRTHEVALPIGVTDAEGETHRQVVLRKMTGREEAILADRRFQRNGGKLVTELLHSCIVSLGDLPSNGRGSVTRMTSVDRNFLLLKLRSLTFGSELDASYTCPACGHVARVTEDLDGLPVRSADGGGEDGYDVEVELEDGYVDRDGQVHTALRLRLPTGADEEAVASAMRDNASTGKNALLGRCLVSLGDLPRTRIEAMGSKILADLTMTDRRLIDRAMAEATPGVDLTRHVECPDCGHEYSASLDLTNFLSLA